jgi:hypothetical protein
MEDLEYNLEDTGWPGTASSLVPIPVSCLGMQACRDAKTRPTDALLTCRSRPVPPRWLPVIPNGN